MRSYSCRWVKILNPKPQQNRTWVGRRRILRVVLAGLVCLVLAGLAFKVFTSRGPVHKGKSLSAGLEEMDGTVKSPESYAAAAEAVREMGTNAIPFLIERLSSRDSLVKQKFITLASKQPLFDLHLTPASDRRYQAVRGFAALGPAAKVAIPALTSLLDDNETALEAALVLSGLGPDASGPLLIASTNASEEVRMIATRALEASRSNAPARSP